MTRKVVELGLAGIFGMVMIVLMVLGTTMLLEWALPVEIGPTGVAAWWSLLWLGSKSTTEQWAREKRLASARRRINQLENPGYGRHP